MSHKISALVVSASGSPRQRPGTEALLEIKGAKEPKHAKSKHKPLSKALHVQLSSSAHLPGILQSKGSFMLYLFNLFIVKSSSKQWNSKFFAVLRPNDAKSFYKIEIQ